MSFLSPLKTVRLAPKLESDAPHMPFFIITLSGWEEGEMKMIFLAPCFSQGHKTASDLYILNSAGGRRARQNQMLPFSC